MNTSDLGYTQSLFNINYFQQNLQRMNLNENIVFPKNLMRSILAKCVDEYDPRIYPPAIDEGDSLVLNQEIAKYCGCSSDSVAIGVGGNQLIDLLFRMKLPKPSDVLLIVSPTFSMYSIFARRQGSKFRELWLNLSTAEEPFSLPIGDVKDAWHKSNAKLLALVSPNNPTGNQFPIETVEDILDTSPNKTVMLDEAYVEYAKYDATKRLMKSHKNLVILRTFSKAFGLASLRLGYILSSDAEFIKRFNNDVQYPYPVTGLSIAMAIELLRRKDVVLEWAQKTKKFREELIASLQKLDSIRVIPKSDTNFILVQANNAKEIAEELLSKYAIALKYFPELGREKGFLRITVGSMEANRKLLYALRRIL